MHVNYISLLHVRSGTHFCGLREAAGVPGRTGRMRAGHATCGQICCVFTA